MYFKREMRKAREHYPAGHSTAQPMELNGMQELKQQQSLSHHMAMVVLLSGKRVFYRSAGVRCCVSSLQ